MVESDEYVEGGSIQWRRVGGVFIGTILTLLGYFFGRGILLLSTGVRSVLDGISGFAVAIVEAPFEGAVEAMDTAWVEFTSSLGLFGVGAFIVAVSMTIAFLIVLFWGVRQFALR